MKQSRNTVSSTKLQNIILELNKAALSYLTNNQFDESYNLLKQAQRIISKQITMDPTDVQSMRLAAITYNNLGCYYKKKNKPKVALKYLKKTLQLEVHRIEDIQSTAGTHLNVCAIYSLLGNHKEAADHAKLAIQILEQFFKNKKQNCDQKTYTNTLMISYYNLGVELQYLKQNEESLQSMKQCRDLAKKGGQMNVGILITADQAIKRIEQAIKLSRIKLVDSVRKRNATQQKGNYQFMCKNIKNYPKQPNPNQLLVRYYLKQQFSTRYQSGEYPQRLQPISKMSKRYRLLTQN